MTHATRRASSGRSIDWKSAREQVDLVAVATGLLGPPPGRRGDKGRKLWWSCPLHQDANPSFCVEPGKAWWRCFGCGESGDAATLVMKLTGATFPEAIASLTGGPSPDRKGKAARGPSRKPAPEPPKGPEGMTEAEALACVEGAAERLWSPEGGAGEMRYLTGPARSLRPETIRAARLGFVDPVTATTRDGKPYQARGILIPWHVGKVPSLIKVRQPGGYRPKYAEVFRDRARHSGIYPGPEAIRPGRPLVVVEGEFDALLLGQELGDLASVVTLGSASARPERALLGRMLAAARWYVDTDGDDAGEKAAAGWPASAVRVRPPGQYKDWTDAKAGRVDLARWWRDVFAGVERPEMFTREELAEWRWGPAVGDPSPGIEIP